LIGASAADIRFRETVRLKSTLDLPCLLNRESTIREWFDDPRGMEAFNPVMHQIKALMEQLGELFGAGERPEESISAELMDMPLRSILHFQEKELPQPADDLVDALLAQVHGIKP
jgi:beta-glucosidase